MKRPFKIHPIAAPDALSKDALDSLGFHFTSLHLDKNEAGWLCLRVNWTAEGDHRYRFKCPERGCVGSSSGGGRQSSFVELTFPEVPAPYHMVNKDRPMDPYPAGDAHVATIEVGIQIRTGRLKNPPRLGFDYTYHDCTKYGVAVYFAPRGWEGEKDENLFSWRKRG